jgi:diguanylate cyclase (GGDEF)-like protein
MKVCAPVLAMVLAGWAAAALAAERAPLASVAEVRALSHEDAARQLPVDFTATVTYFRWYEKTLFVQDGGAGVYVNATTDLRLQPGDVVRVRGTAADSFNPIVISSDISVVGHGKLPLPIAVTWPQLIRADYDCRWVRARGTVAVAEIGRTSGRIVTHLVLAMDGGMADIMMENEDPSRFKGLLAAEVEVMAVAGEIFDGKMQQTGVRLHVPSFDYVKVLRRSDADAWTMPLTPMDKVLSTLDLVDRTPHVRVEGTLTYYRQTEMAVLQNGSLSIRVQTSQIAPLNIGDRVQAIGVPSVENGMLTLNLGQIRALGKGTPVTPRPATWDEVASGKYAFNLMSIEGTVVTEVQEQGRDVYVIAAGKHLLSATLRHRFVYEWPLPKDPPPLYQVPLNSRVRVTGVVNMETGNPYNGPVSFTLLLRSAGDIATVAKPPWMSVRHLSEVVGFLVLILLGVGLRTLQVERVARRKIAGMAYLEKRRAKILEMINATRPLAEVLEKMTELVSASLDGAPCWCQVADGARLGNCPPQLPAASMRVVERTIPSRTGVALGSIYAAFDARTRPQDRELEAMNTAAGLATLAIETSRLYSDLVHRSEFDILTDVENRFSLEKFLTAQIQSGRPSAGIFGLLYLDLDKFKLVNDRYGHHVGDLYLQEVARRMKHQLRPGDMLARLGGDEFAAIAAAVHSRKDVEEIACRLERCFTEPFRIDGGVLCGSVSIGIAMYPDDGTTNDALLLAADAAMYRWKNTRHSEAETAGASGKPNADR